MINSKEKLVVFSFMVVLFLIQCGKVEGAAKSIYIAQTAHGSDSGLDTANAHSVAWFNKSGNWGTGSTQINAGDTVYLCGTISSGLTFHGSGAVGNPIIIKFETNTKISNTTWPDNSTIISGTNCNNIIIDGGTNGVIQCTDNGSGSNWKPAGTFHNQNILYVIQMTSCNNLEIKNLTIKQIYQRVPDSNDSLADAYGIVLSYCNHSHIHHCTISDCRRQVGMYCSTNNSVVGAEINNIICDKGASFLEIGGGSGTGSYDSIAIHDNVIGGGNSYDGIWNSGGGHFHGGGVHIYSGNGASVISHVRIYNNEIGKDDMGSCNTAYIFAEANVHAPLIYNNVLYTKYPSVTPTNGFIYLKESTDSALISNNTMYTHDKSGMALCLGSSKGQKVINNLFLNIGTAIRIVDGTFTECSHNLYYNIQSWSCPSVDYTFSAWQKEKFHPDSVGSFQANPNLDTSSFGLKDGSPAINTGKDLSNFYITDFNGIKRPQGSSGSWNIGAFENTKAASSVDPQSGNHSINMKNKENPLSGLISANRTNLRKCFNFAGQEIYLSAATGSTCLVNAANGVNSKIIVINK